MAKTMRGMLARQLVSLSPDTLARRKRHANAAKAELGIHTMQFPKSSPDLNPLDFYLRDAIERRMRNAKTTPMSVADYKAKLRRVAMSIPEDELRKAALRIKGKAKAVHDAKGCDIPRD